MEAALLELFTAATWTGIVSADSLERVGKRKERIGKEQAGIPRTWWPAAPDPAWPHPRKRTSSRARQLHP